MGASVELSCRLLAIAEMVTEGNRLVDVGCDHGYLPVYLMMNKKIPHAIASDVGSGPLSRAQEHIHQYGMEKDIETRLSDGLSGILPGEGDTLVIAGMGGPLMERILTEGEKIRESFREMILQPQSDVPHFRHFLLSNDYQIVEERMILEDGKYYPMMKAVKAQNGKSPVWTREEERFGKLLLEEKNPVLFQYLMRELRIRMEILEKLKDGQGESAKIRRQQIEEERRLIETALKRYEGK